MKRYIRDLRLIPIALIASACLLVLKVADIAFHGSSLFEQSNAPRTSDVAVVRAPPDATAPLGTKLSWAQQMFNFPNSNGTPPLPSLPPIIPSQVAERDNGDITGSVSTTPAKGADGKPDAQASAGGKSGAPAKVDGKDAKDPKPAMPDSALVPTNGAVLPTGAERAILERLQQRREELDARARELDIRESLIQGAEKRMDAKLQELKDVESHIKVESKEKDDADAARLKGLVAMYQNMKARDAAKIFNGLDINVLMQVVAQINPRQMADILAQMQPEVAQHLTVALADKAAQASQAGGVADLPKIQGAPTTN